MFHLCDNNIVHEIHGFSGGDTRNAKGEEKGVVIQTTIIFNFRKVTI